jgi:uncharacterized repeat protein (TIGR01451 family)
MKRLLAAAIPLLLLLLPGVAHAQITADTVTTGASASVATTLNITTHTVGSGTNRLLVVGVALRTDNGGTASQRINSITWNGTALACLAARNDGAGAACGTTGTPTNLRSEMWTLANPASGNFTLAITTNGTTGTTIAATVQSYANVLSVAAGNTNGSTSSGTAASVTSFAIPTNGLEFDSLSIARTSTAVTATGTGHTEIGNPSDTSGSGTHIQEAGGQVTGQASTTASWTWTTGSPFAETTAVLTPLSPPTITKAFAPSTITIGGTSTLTITITNPNASGFTLTGVGVTDNLPAGVTQSGAATSCTSGSVATSTATSIVLTGGSINGGANCTVTATVTDATLGGSTNTTGNVSSSNGGTAGTASATLTTTAFSPPTISKSFGSASMAQNTGTSTMTVTITNPAANTLPLTGVTVSDTFPTGMTVAGANLATTCSGGLTGGTTGSGSFSVNPSTIAAGGSCTVTGSVSSTTSGVNSNVTGNVSSTNGGTGGTATATIAVEVPPTATKSFNPTTVATGIASQLTITVTNPAPPNTVSLTVVTLTDTLPSGLVISNPNGLTQAGCSGTVSAPANGSTISLPSSTLTTTTACVIKVNVQSATAGTYNNTTGAPTSSNGGTGVVSNTATLTVTAPPTATKSFTPPSISSGGTSTLAITITEPGTDAGSMTGIGFTDTFPIGMTITSPSNNLSNNCNGTVTATAGTGTLSLSGGSISTPGASCTISVTVTSATAGNSNNSTGAIASSDGSGTAATATLNVVVPPTITKAFAPTSIAINGTSTLTFTLTNPTGSTVAENGVAFSDTFPADLVVAATPALTNTCGGTVTGATAASNSISLSGGTINTPAGTTCTISVAVTAPTAGAKANTSGQVSSTNGGTGATASATLTVNATPTFTKSFTPTSMAVNGTSVLSLVITNPSGNAALTGLAFSDTFPTNMKIGATVGLTNGCGGAFTGAAGAVSASYTGGTLAAGPSSCTVSFNVTATAAGAYPNTTSTLTSTNGGTAAAASATLNVNGAPTVAKAFLPTSIPISGTSTLTITITNPAANPVAITGMAISDTLPAGVTVAATPNATNTCAGTFTANANAGSISLTGSTVAANSSCAVSASVTATTAGSKVNTTGTLTSTNATTSATATATLTVTQPPTIAKAFNPTSTQINTPSTLTVTITNPAATTQTGVAVTDNLPSGLLVSSSPSATNTCGGTFTANAGTGSISLTGGSIAASGNCAVSASVTPSTTGSLVNTTGPVSSTSGGTGLTATATLTVFNTASQLVWGVQPTNTVAGGTITPAVTVKVEDASGNVISDGPGSTASVSMAIGTNPASGVLGGTTTVNAVAGVATFSTLTINTQGNGYTLAANSSGLTQATSSSFNITIPQVTYTQPFNGGHGWTYTQTSCAVGTIGSCSNNVNVTTAADCQSQPCVDSDAFAGLQTGTSQTGYFHNPIGAYTWQTLGIPANSTVTSVAGGWYDLASGCATGTTAGIQIFDTTNTVEITSPSVASLVQVAGDTSVTNHPVGTAAAVNSTYAASSTGITLHFNLNDDASGFLGTCTLYGDTFQLVINYTPGSAGGHQRGQVVIGWNRQENGTIGQAWAYNVELSADGSPITSADVKLLPNDRSGFMLDPAALEGKGRRVTKLVTE